MIIAALVIGALALIAVGIVCVRTAFPATVVRSSDPAFFDSLEIEVERARRLNPTIAVMTMAPGPASAKALASAIRPHLRIIDVVTLRGDSVVLILTGRAQKRPN